MKMIRYAHGLTYESRMSPRQIRRRNSLGTVRRVSQHSQQRRSQRVDGRNGGGVI